MYLGRVDAKLSCARVGCAVAVSGPVLRESDTYGHIALVNQQFLFSNIGGIAQLFCVAPIVQILSLRFRIGELIFRSSRGGLLSIVAAVWIHGVEEPVPEIVGVVRRILWSGLRGYALRGCKFG